MASLRCSRCGGVNEARARFCIYCGSPLNPESEELAEEPKSIDKEIRELREAVSKIIFRLDALEGVPDFTDEVSLLREMVKQINSRLTSLEERQRAKPTIMPTAVPLPPEPELAKVETTLTPTQKTALEGITGEAKELPREVKTKPARQKREWEQIFGGNWLARIGILALIIGIGFFLKHAFDNNWLGPTARVILGSAAGAVMLWLGFHWRKRYPIMTQVLSGGGIAVLYLSIFASFATYHLVGINVAVMLLLITSILSAIIAMRYNSMALAIIGIFGAFFAPYILGAFGHRGITERTEAQAIQLIVYLIVVDISVLILSTFRNWRWFVLLAFACSMITYGIWYIGFGDQVSIALAEISITIIFISFIGATFLYFFIRRRVPQALDYFLMVLNAAGYAGISTGLMWEAFREWMGGFNLLLALLYGGLAYLAYLRNDGNRRLAAFSFAIAMIFLTAAIPVQFGDRAATTIVWAAEGAVLMWLGLREKIRIFRTESYIIFILAAIRLLVYDSWETGGSVLTPVFNERFLAFVVSIAAIWLTSFLLWRKRDQLTYLEYLFFIAAADFFTVWIIGIEVFHFTDQMITSAKSLSLLILLIPSATLILNPLIWRRQHSQLDDILAIGNALAFIIIAAFIWDDLNAWMGLAALVPAFLYGTTAYYTLKKTSEHNRIGAITLVIAISFLTLAIPAQFRDNAPTTIAWAAETVALVWLSFALKIPIMHRCAYAIFAAMFWRLLIFDTRVDLDNFKPFINTRFLAFVIGIAATYLTAFILWRQKETITKEWRVFAPILLIAASFLTLWIISFEVWQSFTNPLRTATYSERQGLQNAQNLALTAVWAIYAVVGLITGIWRKWRYVRIGALALLVVPIVKVFVYDVFHLQTSYRIGAFVGLGVLLLVSAYLYQRYGKVIKGVFTNK